MPKRYDEMERCDRLELIRRIIRAQEHAQFQGSDRIASRTAIAIDDAIFEALKLDSGKSAAEQK